MNYFSHPEVYIPEGGFGLEFLTYFEYNIVIHSDKSALEIIEIMKIFVIYVIYVENVLQVHRKACLKITLILEPKMNNLKILLCFMVVCP
jgi:hypothetical protein